MVKRKMVMVAMVEMVETVMVVMVMAMVVTGNGGGNGGGGMSEGSLHKWFKGSKSKDGKGGWVNVGHRWNLCE